jgi:MoaA/NifB/PqqE/SkfB family radical SAM enzyme
MNPISRLAGLLLEDMPRYRSHRTALPRFLTHTVTFTCNARCIMCDCWKKDSPDDLTLDEIENIYAQLPPMDAVRLTGGEPFVRPDLTQIHDLALHYLRPMAIHITTNGFLTRRILDLCERRRREVPLYVLVSVDGLEEKHNQVRGRDTAWDGITKTLEALAPRRKELNIRLAINQTIVDAEGVEHYRLLRQHFAPLGILHNAVLAYDASATYSLEDEVELAPSEIGQFTTFGEFTRDHFQALLAEVESELPDLPWPERIARRYYWRGIAARMLPDGVEAGSAEALAAKSRVPNPPCVALNAHLRLFPNGDVPTCQFNTKKAGSLRHQTFEEMWFGTRAENQRDWVRKCPGCWAECEVLPSAIYTGELAKSAFAR